MNTNMDCIGTLPKNGFGGLVLLGVLSALYRILNGFSGFKRAGLVWGLT